MYVTGSRSELSLVDTTNYVRDGGDDDSLGRTQLSFENAAGDKLGDPCTSYLGNCPRLIGLLGACPWLVSVPWGFRSHLKYLYKRYKKPIM